MVSVTTFAVVFDGWSSSGLTVSPTLLGTERLVTVMIGALPSGPACAWVLWEARGGGGGGGGASGLSLCSGNGPQKFVLR